jgi:hypothetical protein
VDALRYLVVHVDGGPPLTLGRYTA